MSDSGRGGAKRKRSISISSSQHLPRDSINPLSHPPGTLRQFAVAGLAETEPLPSDFIRGFPHRPLPAKLGPAHGEDGKVDEVDEIDEADENEAETAAGGNPSRKNEKRKRESARRRAQAQERQLGALTAILLRSLEEGDIPRAKRAFGLLVRTHQQGAPLDLRQNAYWSIGAEILMRDGETKEDISRTEGGMTSTSETAQDGKGETGRPGGKKAIRWGSANNILKVQAYFQELIQQHPYSRQFPQATSALDFWPALMGCEFYNVYVEHNLALQRLEAARETWGDPDDMMDEPVEEGYYGDEDQLSARAGARQDLQEQRMREQRDELQLLALEAMRDIAARMDGLMQTPPYATAHELLRLRGMVALFVGDLVVPPLPRSREEEETAQRMQEEERDRAEGVFRKIIDNGGQVDPWIKHFLDPDGADDDDDDESEAVPVYSSLPIRNG